jgi:hypothetical protein
MIIAIAVRIIEFVILGFAGFAIYRKTQSGKALPIEDADRYQKYTIILCIILGVITAFIPAH